MGDDHDLGRFVAAYASALAELRAGRKTSHWMWFVFPQLAGLGRSPTAQRYAIASPEGARAYLRHPVLGPRLAACAGVLAETTGLSADDILGGTDAMKLRSSMTLFARAAPDQHGFRRVLDRFFDGAEDPQTVHLLGKDAPSPMSGRCVPQSLS